RGRPGGYNDGFTLIEIMVAMAIASIILIMVYASYRSILDSIRRSSGHAEFYENVNLAILKIDKDISNAYFSRTNKNIAFICDDYSGNGRLSFASVNHNKYMISGPVKAQSNTSDIVGVGYFLRIDSNTKGLHQLVKRERTAYWEEDTWEEGEENVILPNVQSLKFEFQRGTGWEENWDSRQNNMYPRAVKTTLVVKDYQAREETFEIITILNIREYR
ncbi:MAG: prepilin-type N-terminal cleavage/methylation domain-containing protein, partial [Chrysiogenales bacterium]